MDQCISYVITSLWLLPVPASARNACAHQENVSCVTYTDANEHDATGSKANALLSLLEKSMITKCLDTTDNVIAAHANQHEFVTMAITMKVAAIAKLIQKMTLSKCHKQCMTINL